MIGVCDRAIVYRGQLQSPSFSEQLLRMQSLGLYFPRPKLVADRSGITMEHSKSRTFAWPSQISEVPVLPREPSILSSVSDWGPWSWEAAHVYICPQNLMKFHPVFDVVIESILSADFKAILIIVYNRVSVFTMLRFKDYYWYCAL